MEFLRKKLNLNPRFLLTILTILVVGLATSVAIFLAKGYKFSPDKKTFTGTGIISITSQPDQASVYLDGHLTTTTNANINSLVPKKYQVKIIKDGFIPWEKEVEVKEGLVSNLKVRLFPSIPTIYPLTYSSVLNPVLSADGNHLVYVVPGNGKKSGVWVWTMSQDGIGFGRGSEPHQLAEAVEGIDYSQAHFIFSPDSTQIMAVLPDRTLMLDTNSLNDPPRDVTAIYQPTLNSWKDEESLKKTARIELIKDKRLKKIASDSAKIVWSPDETKFLYTDKDSKTDFEKIGFKIVDLAEKKTYDLPEAENALWLSDSRHLLLLNSQEGETREDSVGLRNSQVSVVEFDGKNNVVVYAGSFDPRKVYVSPDGSRFMIITTFPTPTAQEPNLYGVNLK